MEKHLVALGKRIAYLRNKKGYTQEKLAELVSYSTNHIGKLESARTNPSFELLVNLSKALDVELSELFNFSEYKELDFIKKEIVNLINSDTEKTKQLYKIYRCLNS